MTNSLWPQSVIAGHEHGQLAQFPAEEFERWLRTRASTPEELPSSLVPLGNISGVTRKLVFVAPFPCRVAWGALTVLGSGVAADDSNYWNVILRRFGHQPYATIYKDLIASGNPTFYAPLQELSGSVAAAYAGAPAGTYDGGKLLAQPGPPSTDEDLAPVFNGGDSRVTIPSTLFPAAGLTVSFEAWVKPRIAPDGSTRMTILGAENAAGVPQFELGFTGSGGTPTGSIALITPGNIGIYTDTSFPGVTVGDWNHVAYVGGGSTGSRFYCNGNRLNAHLLTGGAFSDVATAHAIGRRASSSQYFDGSMAHVAYYQTALTQSDISARYGTIARLGTEASVNGNGAGMAIVQGKPWLLDNAEWNATNCLLREGETVMIEFSPVGSPAALTDAYASLRVQAL